MTNIFEKIGGEPAVRLVVDKFYDNILADEKTAHFFKGTDMAKQRKSQSAFICMVLKFYNLGSWWTQSLLRKGHEGGPRQVQDYQPRS